MKLQMLTTCCKSYQDIIIFVVAFVKNRTEQLLILSSKRFCCVKIHKEMAVFLYKHDRFPQFFVDFRHVMCYH